MEENKAQKRISENQVPKLIKMVDEKVRERKNIFEKKNLRILIILQY